MRHKQSGLLPKDHVDQKFMKERLCKKVCFKSASYPDVSLSMKMSPRRKIKNLWKKDFVKKSSPAICTLPMVPCGSSPVARHYLAKNAWGGGWFQVVFDNEHVKLRAKISFRLYFDRNQWPFQRYNEHLTNPCFTVCTIS